MKRFLSLLLALLLLICGTGLAEVLVDDGVALDDDRMVEYGFDYTGPEDVALYLHAFRELPPNYLTKNEAYDMGWKSKGTLDKVAPGLSIGGDRFGNREGLLPSAKKRQWYECDVNYVRGSRGAERLLFSSDGLIYYSGDHYMTAEPIYEGWYDLGDGGDFIYGVDDWNYQDFLEYGK